MNMTSMMVISNSDYGTLCLVAGLGWGLFLSTLVAAIIVDGIRWRKWINR